LYDGLIDVKSLYRDKKMQYVRISKVTKNLNLVYTGNYIIPGVIIDYRETTRLVTIEHLAKLLFSGVSANQMEFYQFVIGVTERISAYLRKQK
jgi:hypothetical protein